MNKREKKRFDLEMFAGGKTYTGFHSIRKIPERMTLAPLLTGVWWRGTLNRLCA